VVGSTLHLSAGSVETRRFEGGEGDRAALALELPGARSGRVLASPPDGALVPVHVWFEDRIELEILGRGVVRRADMSD
jgi:hypothetical protein